MTWIIAVLLGFVSLGSEVTFTRTCELLLGNTSVTMAAVLAAYLVGLGVGSRVGGRSGLVEERPARAFALAQLVLAAAVLASSRLLPLVDSIPAPRDASLLSARAAVAVLLLLPPALAAGFSFPPLVVLLERGRCRAGGAATGGAYALETLGAVLGALLAVFFLYRAFGLNGTYLILSGTAVLAALLALAAGERAADRESRASSPSAAPGPAVALLGPLALAGAAVLALELLWTRLLLFFVPGLVSALAAVLAGILSGTALGGGIGGALARSGAGRRAAARFLLLAGAGVALSLFMLTVLGDLLRRLPRPPGGGYQPGMDLLAGFLAAGALALVATACSGAALPLVVQALGRGPRVGAARAYSWSCAGSVAGVLAAATAAGVLLPVRTCVMVAGFGLVAAGLWLWRPRRDGAATPLLAAGAAAVLLLAPRAQPMLTLSVESRKSFFAGRTVLATDQDAHVIASVVDMGPGRGRALYTNAFQAASTGRHYGYMRMLGHLPVLLAESPRRVLVIAYGTGTTVGSVALHDEVRRIEIAELSPAVMRLAPYFDEVNHGVPHATERGKEVVVRYGDGRAVVAVGTECYDVITLEPLPPNTPAAVHFYTREFYSLCAARLAPGGVLCQWIPLFSAPLEKFKILVRTFAKEFDAAALFVFDQCVLLIGAPRGSGVIEGRLVLERCAPPMIRADLFRANMEGAAAVLAVYVAGRETLLAATAGGEIMGDDRPSVALDLACPDLTYSDNSAENAAFLHSIKEDVTPRVSLEGLDPTTRAAFLRSLRRSVDAKRLLLEARFSVRPQEPLARALEIAPGDLEALDLLGRKPAGPPAPGTGSESGEVERVLGNPEATKAELVRAIDRAGAQDDVDPTLLLPLLDHADLELRMRAMVALSRRLGDIGQYDPAAPAAERRRAIEELRGLLQQ